MFQEYPKWLYPVDGDPVLVESAEEEAELSPKDEPVKRGPGRPKKAAD